MVYKIIYLKYQRNMMMILGCLGIVIHGTSSQGMKSPEYS